MKTLLVAMTAMMLSATDPGRFDYPAPHKGDVVEDHFGHKIAEPYRGLEDLNSAETQAWVAAENKVTFDYLATIPERAKIHERLTQLWNYERFSPPSKEGPWYIFGKNDGLQNQSVVYKTKSPDAPAEVLIDPNTLVVRRHRGARRTSPTKRWRIRWRPAARPDRWHPRRRDVEGS
jgi:prolyl oligopeptidase